MKLTRAEIHELIEKSLLILLIISAFLPIRYVFKLQNNFVTGAYSDFTSFSLYSCDLLIIGLFLYSTWRGNFSFRLNKLMLILIAWLLLIFIINFKSITGLNIYFFTKIIELLILYATIKTLGFDYQKLMTKTFVFLGLVESILAAAQFIAQKSMGLYLLGEQHISPTILGIAKIGLNGVKFVRGYGTFPHPNLLSAFLLTSTLLSLSLVISASKKTQKILYSTLLIINTFGLFMSFSRAGLLSLIIALVLFFGIALIKTGLHKRMAAAVLIILITLSANVLILKPFLLARSNITDDQSAKERIFYNKIGIEMIKDHQIAGIGIGTSVLHMEQYSPNKLQPWEIQPIHNYYLLTAAELGIVGSLILILIFFSHLKNLFDSLKDFSYYRLALFSILVGFLILMLFDHYFYTIQQTQILLWLVLGLIAAEIFGPKLKSTP